jgi:hypothetical protein
VSGCNRGPLRQFRNIRASQQMWRRWPLGGSWELERCMEGGLRVTRRFGRFRSAEASHLMRGRRSRQGSLRCRLPFSKFRIRTWRGRRLRSRQGSLWCRLLFSTFRIRTWRGRRLCSRQGSLRCCLSLWKFQIRTWRRGRWLHQEPLRSSGLW